MADAGEAIPGGDEAAWDALLDRAADWLRGGRVVAFPTETVYGLGANALDERSVSLVFALKGRPSNNPLIVHVSGASMARGLCHEWPKHAERLAERFWPGPLTLVLPCASVVPKNVTGGGDTVALRMPDHALALGLIDRFGGPIVGPSANRSGMVSPTTAEHVRESFGDDERVMILDGGACSAGIESTVVSLVGERVCVLRRGVIGADEIAAVLGCEVETPNGGIAAGDADAPMASPGMLSRHYAPQTRAVLVYRSMETEGWLATAGEAARVVAVGSEGGVGIARAALGDALVHGEVMPDDAAAYARALYAALRRADAVAADVMLIERPEGVGAVWEAIRDRLRRGTATDE